jgi:hypothetical protein
MGIRLLGQRPGKQGEDASVSDVSRLGTPAEMATDEPRRISLRTRDALAAYKADRRVSRRIRAMYPGGVPGEVVDAVAGKLGASLPQCRNLTPDARLKGARSAALAHRGRADQAYIDLAPWVAEMRDSGLTLQRIADALNAEGRKTRRGAAWNKVQVRRVLARIRTGTARVLA